MNITKREQSKLHAVITIEVSTKDVEKNVEKVLKNYRKEASLPGFRKGNIPISVIEKKYKTAVIADEVNKLVNSSLQKYLETEKIKFLGNPIPFDNENIDWKSENFIFNFELGLSPKINLKFPNRKPITRYNILADDNFIDQELIKLQKQYGKIVPSNEVSSSSEFLASITYDGNENNKDVTFSYEEIKSKKVKKELNKINSIKEFNFSSKSLFYDDNAFLRFFGAVPKSPINFKLFVKEHNQRIPCDLNQEFFDKIFGGGKVKSIKDCKKELKNNYENHFKNQSKQKFLNDMTERLIDNTKFSLPKDFLVKWLSKTSKNKITMDEAASEYLKMEKGIRYQLIESSIIEENKIEISPDDIKASFIKNVEKQMLIYGRKNISEDELNNIVKRLMDNQDEVKRVYSQILNEKIYEIFNEKGKFKSKSISYDNFIKISKKN